MLPRYIPIGGLIYCALALPSAHAAACTAAGDTRTDAAQRYAGRCELPLKDCDPIDGRWYCSSDNIDAGTFNYSELEHLYDGQLASEPVNEITSLPVAVTASCVDPDGDGWGWDGESSCLVVDQGNGQSNQDQSSQNQGSQDQSNTVDSGNADWSHSTAANISIPCLDPDGDGWGWDGSASCLVTQSANETSQAQNNQAQTDQALTNQALTNQAEFIKKNDGHCNHSYNPTDITDLVLVTGQSNVTGAETRVSATLDQWGKVIEFHAPDEPHPRVFAWTVNPGNNNAGTGWKIAALNQSWHDSAPGVGGIARNNFAFHFAKQVADRGDCRVVGFVMVSEGGKGISHWDYNAPGWNEVEMQVTEAMSAIGRSSIDGILWHQGESDWIVDGTCYTGGRCQNNRPDYYAQKLYSKIASQSVPNAVGNSALVDRLRSQSWYNEGKPFIAGETIQAPVNIHLNKLNTDGDQWTACVHSDIHSGLGIRDDDPFKNHYNADGLRALGALYATEYLKMTGK